MRTVRFKVYKFEELKSDSAKQKAIKWYRDAGDDPYLYDEINSSIEAAIKVFGLQTGRDYSDIRSGHIDDCILELSGVRLYKYIINNYYDDLFDHKYIKLISRDVKTKAFIVDRRVKDDSSTYVQLFSKIQMSDQGGALTGMAYDDMILKPVYDFLKRPESGYNYSMLIDDIESAIGKTYRDTEEWINSDQYITENIISNQYEFTADGKHF